MSLEQAREWLRSATAVAVLTGAGISAESGIPTFRGTGGLWRDYKPEDLATPEAFARDPRLVWEWYNWRRAAIQQAKPNAGHAALVRLEIQKPNFTLITQNVDGLHDMAGSGRILKLHGDIWRMRCTSCGSNWPDRRGPVSKLPPRTGCGGLGGPRGGGAWARAGVVWSGEPLPEGMIQEAQHATLAAQVLLVVGTSAQVYPAAGLIPLAKQAGARVIQVNLEPTPYSGIVDCALEGPAGELLPQLIMK